MNEEQRRMKIWRRQNEENKQNSRESKGREERKMMMDRDHKTANFSCDLFLHHRLD
jgi:hypothetical protein